MAGSSDLRANLRATSRSEIEHLGKYELLRHLATGGMADIYLARVTGIEGFEKIVVVKRILKDLLRNQEMVRMFLDEARLAATLYHPNVVPVYDVGSAGGDYFFAMEFVHGENVGEILRTVTANAMELSLAEAISIVLGVCSGIHYAHEKVGLDGRALNIVHRDVSPSNVLVSYDGAVKIVDFGIAKAENRLSQKTQTGGIRGKFSYMSPEQCQAKALDRRSDLFSLSILLYELTTCTKLYRGESEYEVMRRIVEAPAPPPSTRRQGYPIELERIVMRGLARNADDRYTNAQQMQLDLEAFMLENRMSTSPIQLARLMERLFADRIAAWRDAQSRGLSLIDYLSSDGVQRPPRRHRTTESMPDSPPEFLDEMQAPSVSGRLSALRASNQALRTSREEQVAALGTNDVVGSSGVSGAYVAKDAPGLAGVMGRAAQSPLMRKARSRGWWAVAGVGLVAGAGVLALKMSRPSKALDDAPISAPPVAEAPTLQPSVVQVPAENLLPPTSVKSGLGAGAKAAPEAPTEGPKEALRRREESAGKALTANLPSTGRTNDRPTDAAPRSTDTTKPVRLQNDTTGRTEAGSADRAPRMADKPAERARPRPAPADKNWDPDELLPPSEP